MQKPSTPIVIVAAMGRNTRVIGDNNQLLWHIPADLKRFKSLTLGHPIIMGRKTFESIIKILGKPLPVRTNIVVTRDPEYKYGGAISVTSLEEAFQVAQKENPVEIHIGGGTQIYEQALPHVDKLYLTFIDDDQNGDSIFPDFSNNFKITKEYPPENYEGLSYQWVDWERK